jgi:large subunit ribosomal protein L18
MSKAKGPVYTVYFRRRRECKTDYQKRLALVKSGKPRMVVRKSNAGIMVQFVDYDSKGDKILSCANGKSLKKLYSWPSKRNVYTAYLCGLLAAKKAHKAKVSEFVLDLGLQIPSKGSVLFAALKGAVDAGLKTSFSEDMLPKEKLTNVPEAIKGKFEEVKGKISSS